ncbi:hypothetical protein ACP4OV_022375 [Aristida adscensionis]
MRNASGGCWSRVALPSLQQVFGAQAASHGLGRLLGGAAASASPAGMGGDGEVASPPPLLLRALASLNLLLLVVYLLLLLLAKLFVRAGSRASWEEHDGCDHRVTEAATETETEDGAAADIVGGRQADVLFWFDEAVLLQDGALLGDEGKDHPYNGAARCVQAEGAFRTEESACISSCQDHRVEAEQQQQEEVEAKDIAVDVPEQRHVVAVVTSPENVPVEGNLPVADGKESGSHEDERRRHDDNDGHGEHEAEEEEEEEEEAAAAEEKGISEGHDVKLFVNSRALADTRKLLLEGVVAGGGGGGDGGGARLMREDKEEERGEGDSSRFGASTLTSESTSKSSVEWRSSTVTKDSETEYPFSSSSRRSSSRWESYTLFRKYDEDMVYFHRVGAQKLTETESFRSIKYQPRSMSERIVQKLAPKPSAPIGLRDPYPDLERAYVAQVCLTWEALNWNYTSFRRLNAGDGNIASRCCPARVAQEFQQFQVLLHRFIENEPYECGRRPEVYARIKNSSPRLLLVPEFREEEDEKDDLISAVQFLIILEESIRTFMAFLRADKRSHYEMFKEMVKRRSSAADQGLVIALKKLNKKKKSQLKDLTRPRRCLRRTKLREEEELSILLGLIDVKVVARVLRTPEVTDQQLHWCEEKMNRVRVDPEGKMQRDASPLLFPAH